MSVPPGLTRTKCAAVNNLGVEEVMHVQVQLVQ